MWPSSLPLVNDDALLDVMRATVAAVRAALSDVTDWGLNDRKPGQHHSDVAADAAALDVLLGAGLGVLSEETGLHHPERDVVVVVDPLDGSTNALHGLPWYACSLGAVDPDGARVALVENLATGERFEAVRGGGATRDGQPIRPTSVTDLGDALVGLSGYPTEHLGWRQFRAYGAGALDLCAVACGQLDAYLDAGPGMHTPAGDRSALAGIHGPWDYLGAMLVCQEAGAVVGDVHGRDLVILEHEARRAPIAAATPELYQALLEATLAERRGRAARAGS